MYNSSFQRRRYPRRLWHACRPAFTTIAFLLIGWSALCQNYPNGLSSDSVDPIADSLYIEQIRHYLDSIRLSEGRPTVALVLSGGGAKGAAEAGALKYFEEQNIPVDFVLGTSIGGLIGSLYSLGYSIDEITEIFQTQDWNTTLTDRIEPQFIPYTAKLRARKYLLSIPFHYDDSLKSAGASNSQGLETYSDNQDKGKLDLGAHNANKAQDNRRVRGFMRSLPSGYAYGFNVNNLISSLTVGYQDSISFAKMPIPFLCVASDMLSFKAKYWSEGYLKTAMRSTMSIPGLYDPLNTGGYVLVDGGIINNYPTDFAKAVGADYIIGIELFGDPSSTSEIYNVGSIASRFINSPGRAAIEDNIKYPDLRVRPEISEYNMMSFNPVAIDTMINRGYRAFEAESEALAAIKKEVGERKEKPARQAVNIAKTPVQIRSIEIENLNDKECRLLMEKIGLNAGQMVDKEIMDAAMSRIQATGAFEAISYALKGREQAYDLVFSCTPGPTHEIGLGARLDTEEWAAVLLRAGLNTRKLSGFKFDFSARLSTCQELTGLASIDIPRIPTLNAELRIKHSKYTLYNYSYSPVYKSILEHMASQLRLYFSNLTWAKYNFDAGTHMRFFNVDAAYFGFFTSGRMYTLDDYYFPTKGISLNLDWVMDFKENNNPSFTPIHSFGADIRFVLPCGPRFAIIPDFHWRSCFGNEEKSSFYHHNFAGGDMNARYFDQQMRFAVCNNVFFLEDHATVLNLDFRFRLSENIYVSAIASSLKDGPDLSSILNFERPTIYGFAGQFAYNSILGPLKLTLRWNEKSKWTGALSMGLDF